MTGRPRHRDRLFRGHRPRTSTLVLIGLFVGVFALYILVRPIPAPAANVDQVTPTHSQQPAVPGKSSSPTPTRSPSHSPSPSPHRTTVTPTTSHTPATSGPTSPTPSVTLQGGSPTA
jgi:cytoskeletal protein RodZ